MIVETSWCDNVATLSFESAPVNALGFELRSALLEALVAANARAPEAIVLTARGKLFSAGADIREFDQPPREPLLGQLLDAVAGNPCPVVALVNGSALGGGCELALACHARCATPSAQFALPETKLGLIPGGGGTQRLPHLVGFAVAYDLISSGRTIDANEAARIGLADRIAESLDRNAVLSLVAQARARGRRVAPDAASFDFEALRARLGARSGGKFAQARLILALQAAATLPLDRGLARERELFIECRGSRESAALRYQFQAERLARQDPAQTSASWPKPFERVGIVGAGAMGSGIAVACAVAGLSVVLIDSSEAACQQGLQRIAGHLAEMVERKRLTPEAVAASLARIRAVQDFAALADAELVIEAVIEDPAVKASVFAELGRVCRPETLLATNTSALDIDELAAASSRPERVLGLHFFSPAHVMRLLEIVRGAATSPITLAGARRFAQQLGKVGVVAGNAFGFIGNRMLQPYMREAQLLVLEGVAPARVDAVMREFGFAMGPLEVRDLAGIDIALAIRAERSRRGLLPPDERPFAVLERLAAAGRLGRKTGAGFYVYPPGARRGVEDATVAQLVAVEAARLRVPQRQIDDEEIRDRCLLPLIMEGARLLEEGIAARPQDIDVVWVHGYGFPREWGGPMWWADRQGLPVLVKRIESLGLQLGDPFGYWQVPALLRERSHL